MVDRLFGNTRYFVIKSNNYENVDIAKTRVSVCVCTTDCIYIVGKHFINDPPLSSSECLVYFAVQRKETEQGIQGKSGH